ncbi:MAG: CotH kinase family protein [Mariprofundales bacterium]
MTAIIHSLLVCVIFASSFFCLCTSAYAASTTDTQFKHRHLFDFSQEVWDQARLSAAEVVSLHLRMNDTDAQVLFNKPHYDKSTFSVDIHEGELDDDKTARLSGRISVQGNSTRTLAKKSVIVKLKKNQQWYGNRRISLRAMASDSSMMREWLSWKLLKAQGMAVPDVRYVRLSINGEYIGLYLHIEWIDQHLLTSHGAGTSGQLFHPSDRYYCGNLMAASIERISLCWAKLMPADHRYGDLNNFIRSLKNAPIEQFNNFLDKYTTADSVLNWMTANVLTSNGDTYNKNYFFYRSDNDGRWLVIPWDYDLTFGKNWDPVYEYPRNVFNDNFQYFYPPEAGAPNPIKAKIWLNAELRKRMNNNIKHLLGLEKHGLASTFGWFAPDVMQVRISQLAAVIKPAVLASTIYQQDAAQFTEAVESVQHYSMARAYFLNTKLFGQYPWNPTQIDWMLENGEQGTIAAAPVYTPPTWLSDSATLTKNSHHVTFVDGAYGLFLANVDFKKLLPVDINLELEVESNQEDKYVPPHLRSEQCLRRSWLIYSRTPFLDLYADIELEYLEENSLYNELAMRNKSEDNMVVWVLDGLIWQPLATSGNRLSNTLKATGLHMRPGSILRLVACQDKDTTIKKDVTIQPVVEPLPLNPSRRLNTPVAR